MKTLLFLLTVGMATSAGGQALRIEDFEPILLPAASYGRPGSHGSAWETEFTVRNDASEAVTFGQGEPICRLVSCRSPLSQIEPMSTERWDAGTVPEIPYVGALFYVERKHSALVTMNLRLRETSRNQSSLGTNLPVIRESELRTGKIQLLNVPVDSLHRINLRIFEIDRHAPEVSVRIFGGDDLLWSERRVLSVPDPRPFGQYPAEDVLYNVQEIVPSSACCDPIRIEIEPLQSGRYWAYATLVNNATQEVLLVTPE